MPGWSESTPPACSTRTISGNLPRKLEIVRGNKHRN